MEQVDSSSAAGQGGSLPSSEIASHQTSTTPTPRPMSVELGASDVPATKVSETTIVNNEKNTPPADLATTIPVMQHDGAQAGASNSPTPQPSVPVASNSDSEAKPTATDAAMTDPVVYGTRSRNRSDGKRINYAEDADQMDFEYSSASAPQKPDAKRVAATATTTSTSTPSADSPRTTTQETISKFISVKQNHNEKSTSKDSPAPVGPGSVTAGKKRKAVTGTHTPDQPAAASSSTMVSFTTSSTRRSGGSTVSRPETNMMTFTTNKSKLNKDGKLIADDGTALGVNDHVYLVCEPPGDPYYLCRIMEFVHTKSDDRASPVDAVRVNWFYRPRDVQRYNNDTRLVYATMHSDVCPLTSLRGTCQILHRSEIADLDEYRKGKDSFWFSQVFDRFIRRFYEVIPTSDVINVPSNVKKALDERWKFIAVETGRVKELTSQIKLCKRCAQYCASHDSVDCAICGNSYHMNCVRPPLPKKPSRGFAWACGPCGRAQEKKMEARHTPTLGEHSEAVEEEIFEEEEEDPNLQDSTRAPSPTNENAVDQHPGTQAEIAMAQMWPFRYLGIHCRVEDALQYDDRAIYPRASSRLGPRHQANTNVWHGRPVELVKPFEIKKKYVKTTSHKKDAKLSKETIAAVEADRAERAKRPKWVMDEPPGYVARGEDYDNDDPRNTAKLIFKMPEEEEKDDKHKSVVDEAFVDEYMERSKALAPKLRVGDYSVNFKDKALELLLKNKYKPEPALEQLAKVDRGKDLKEPVFTTDDLKKFEDGVQKYGSEHRLIKQHMKTHIPISSIIRFYYLWKKTPRGRNIWDNYGGRKGSKKKNLDSNAKIQAEVADDADDSAFDSGKAASHKREFQCKFCNTKNSRHWRRAPGVAPGQAVAPEGKGSSKDKTPRPLLALCLRCAGLWRRYAIQWEDLEEVGKKVAASGGRAWKRRIDEELLRELQAANELASMEPEPAVVPSIEAAEPPKKKTKTGEIAQSKPKPSPALKVPTPPPPPIVPEPPKRRVMPCAVCKTIESAGSVPISCTHCMLTVHKHCYGLADRSVASKWVCDQCTNDRNLTVSTEYKCRLCPIEFKSHDLWEAPKVSHKKKTDRDREKERLEKELLEAAKRDYVKRQNDLGRPLEPREPLKMTQDNNWVHVVCAVWTPEIRFSNAKVLERAEGVGAMQMSRFEAICKLCKKGNDDSGACISCQQCHANFHAACAFEAGYTFGFDMNPVKGSRKDTVTSITLGQETGTMAAAVWCRDHSVKTIIHPMDEVEQETGKTALQLYVENFKQADQALTGTARKANLLKDSMLQLSKAPQASVTVASAVNRRVSTTSVVTTGVARKGRNSVASIMNREESGSPVPAREANTVDKECATCGINVSPVWFPYVRPAAPARPNGMSIDALTNGDTVKNESKVEHAPLPLSELSANQQNKSLVQCAKCRHPSKTEKRPIPLLSASSLPINDEWPPSSMPPPPQFQPPPYGWPHHMGQPNGPDVGHMPQHHQYPPHMVPPGFAPPPPMPPNGMSYGQPHAPPGQQHYGGPTTQYYDRAPPPSQPQPQQPIMAPQSAPNGAPVPQFSHRSPSFPPQAVPPPYPARGPSTESAYPGHQQLPTPTGPGLAPQGSHGSPAAAFARPSTPRDATLDPRLSGGASASPSLRNLLH